MITTTHLTKVFKTKKAHPGIKGLFREKITTEFTAVSDLTISIDKGEFVALLGPNGAGKTTTLKMLTGILYPSSGTISVCGYEPVKRQNEFKKAISFVMAQKSQLFLELPVKDTFEFIMEIYGVNNQQTKKLLNELVERFQVGDKLVTQARRLSLGQRMKCELICSFLYQPQVIFLDEPTIGLDINSVGEVRKFLKETNDSLGTTIVLTTHNMDDVEELCPRTIMINKGKKIFDGKTDDLKKMFGDERIIEFVIEGKCNEDIVAGFNVIEKSTNSIKIKVNRQESARAINTIMNACNVVEINFTETDLSEVVAKIYLQ